MGLYMQLSNGPVAVAYDLSGARNAFLCLCVAFSAWSQNVSGACVRLQAKLSAIIRELQPRQRMGSRPFLRVRCTILAS